jgi:hypothetical protein
MTFLRIVGTFILLIIRLDYKLILKKIELQKITTFKLFRKLWIITDHKLVQTKALLKLLKIMYKRHKMNSVDSKLSIVSRQLYIVTFLISSGLLLIPLRLMLKTLLLMFLRFLRKVLLSITSRASMK